MTFALVIGCNGQLAQELARCEWPSGWKPIFLGRDEIDLAHPIRAATAVIERKPELVINAAAYTAVDRAESQPDLAIRVNAEAPAAIASECAAHEIPFVTISTDYVFDGASTVPYVEGDSVRPINVYGRSKAEGEAAVREAGGPHLILRTSWVFSAYGSNFVRTMLRLAADRESINVVADQRGRPTAAGDLAHAVIVASELLLRDLSYSGTYHVANAGETTWYDFAAAIFAGAKARGRHVPQLKPITTEQYPTPARRPANSVLSTDAFEHRFGLILRPWRQALDDVLEEAMAESTMKV
jgi:dTDP-4-dehydrorhamnose reductase